MNPLLNEKFVVRTLCFLSKRGDLCVSFYLSKDIRTSLTEKTLAVGRKRIRSLLAL